MPIDPTVPADNALISTLPAHIREARQVVADYASGAFTALTTTGNTILGDASTDTVTVSGYMGVGSAPTIAVGVYARNASLATTTQVGVYSAPIGTSAATGYISAVSGAPETSASSFTCSDLVSFKAENGTKGAGSTVTNKHGLKVEDQTIGTNNFGITSLVSSGTNKWNIYASGTAANYFAGNLLIGTTTNDGVNKLQVNGTAKANGFAFPATQVASSDPNTLDDYEEGIWIPYLNGSTSGSIAMSTSYYTKVGNLVTVFLKMNTNIPTDSLVGNLSITGLPYTSNGSHQIPVQHIRGVVPPYGIDSCPFGIINNTTLYLHDTTQMGSTAIYDAAGSTYPATKITQNGITSIIMSWVFQYRV